MGLGGKELDYKDLIPLGAAQVIEYENSDVGGATSIHVIGYGDKL